MYMVCMLSCYIHYHTVVTITFLPYLYYLGHYINQSDAFLYVAPVYSTNKYELLTVILATLLYRDLIYCYIHTVGRVTNIGNVIVLSVVHMCKLLVEGIPFVKIVINISRPNNVRLLLSLSFK